MLESLTKKECDNSRKTEGRFWEGREAELLKANRT